MKHTKMRKFIRSSYHCMHCSRSDRRFMEKETKYTASTHGNELEKGNQEGKKRPKTRCARNCLTRVAHNSLRLTNPWPSNSRSNWNLEMLIFEEGGKPENPEKTLGARARTNKKLNPHMTPGPANRTRDTLVGGERSHHCATPAPLQG